MPRGLMIFVYCLTAIASGSAAADEKYLRCTKLQFSSDVSKDEGVITPTIYPNLEITVNIERGLYSILPGGPSNGKIQRTDEALIVLLNTTNFYAERKWRY